jgi:hypothetical protein
MQLVYASGTRDRSTSRTSAAGVSFADSENASAGILAFVLQLRFEHTPARIQYGFCHPCLNQLETAHVANDYVLIPINNLSRKFMERIGTAARRFPVNPLGLSLVPATLCIG